MCTDEIEGFPDGLCIPYRWGATRCGYENGHCKLYGDVCNPQTSLAVPEQDRLIFSPAAGALETVVAVRLEENTFGTWTCTGELEAAYRDLGKGMIVEVAPDELNVYKSLYNFEAYTETALALIEAAGG